MLLAKIDPILDEVAEKSGYSKEIVGDVIKHLFSYIRRFLIKPNYTGIRIPLLGVIRPDKKPLNFYLKTLIKQMRLSPNDEELKETFRTYWNLRRLLQQDDKRRNYKKRYGKWHFK